MGIFESLEDVLKEELRLLIREEVRNISHENDPKTKYENLVSNLTSEERHRLRLDGL